MKKSGLSKILKWPGLSVIIIAMVALYTAQTKAAQLVCDELFFNRPTNSSSTSNRINIKHLTLDQALDILHQTSQWVENHKDDQHPLPRMTHGSSEERTLARNFKDVTVAYPKKWKFLLSSEAINTWMDQHYFSAIEFIHSSDRDRIRLIEEWVRLKSIYSPANTYPVAKSDYLTERLMNNFIENLKRINAKTWFENFSEETITIWKKRLKIDSVKKRLTEEENIQNLEEWIRQNKRIPRRLSNDSQERYFAELIKYLKKKYPNNEFNKTWIEKLSPDIQNQFL